MKIVYFNYLYDLYEGSLGSTLKAIRLMRALEEEGHVLKTFWLNAKREAKGNGKTSRSFAIGSEIKGLLSPYLHEVSQIVSNMKYWKLESKILQVEKPDLVISRLQTYLFSSVLLSKRKGLPVLLEVDCPAAYENRTFFPQYLKVPGLAERIEKWTLSLADAVFVVSNQLKTYVAKRGVPGERIAVIPNAADVEHEVRRNGVVRDQYGIRNRVVIGFVGSFHHWHGVSELFHLILSVTKVRPQSTFLLVGSGGPRGAELTDMVKQHGLEDQVILTGFVHPDQVSHYITAMDIVLAPYPNLEFFYYSPVKVFEYMAYGKAIVTSRIGQLGELIRNERNGLLCEPGNIDDYIRKILLLVDDADLRNRLGEQARKEAEAKHSWSVRGRALSKVCEDLLTGRLEKPGTGR